MFGEVIDALAEYCDLNFGRAGIGFVRAVAADQLRFMVFGKRHLVSSTYAPDADCTSAPYVADFLTPARSACYIRTTEGCKTPDAPDGSASPISSPAGS